MIEAKAVRQENWSLSRRYGVFTFPAAYRIDEHGTISHDAVRGDDVSDLLRTLLRDVPTVSRA